MSVYPAVFGRVSLIVDWPSIVAVPSWVALPLASSDLICCASAAGLSESTGPTLVWTANSCWTGLRLVDWYFIWLPSGVPTMYCS